MILHTHNSIRNNSKYAKIGYPLMIKADRVEIVETNFNPKFMAHILPSLNWETLVSGSQAVGLTSLPPKLTTELINDTNFLQALHHILFNVHVVTGKLTCPETGREFEIKNGIIKFILAEDECEIVRA